MERAVGRTRPALEDDALRRVLIEELWPDKSLYAAVLLFLTGFVGLLTWAVDVTVGVSYAARVPGIFTMAPSWLALLFSLCAVACAVLALRDRSTVWTIAGAACAFLSVGFLAANAVLALVTLEFVRRAKQEGEGENPATRHLHADMWPDKLLAASLIMVIAGTLTVLWGAAVTADLVTYAGYAGPRIVFGVLVVAAGILCLVAARLLYRQRAPLLSLCAAVATGAAVAVWVVGPVLAFAAAVLILLGLREAEFQADVAPS